MYKGFTLDVLFHLSLFSPKETEKGGIKRGMVTIIKKN